MPSPQLHVETIAFHGNDVNALPLLVGQGRITGPEWTRAGARLPAAVVVPPDHDHIAINATFSSPDLAGRTTTVFASRLDGTGHVLQDVVPASVTFDSMGRSGHVELRVTTSNRGIDLDAVSWQWKFRDSSGVHEATISEHEIAVILASPLQPWTTLTPAPAGTSLPWWEVLRHACDAARGAGTLREAAVRLTETVFGVWGGRYYRWNQIAETFASDAGDPESFDCQKFLGLLGAPPPAVLEIVDCSDIATILSTFASILGCPIQQVVLEDVICHVKLVGHDTWGRREFPMHELAVSVPLGSSPEVWDGCLMVSGDEPIVSGDPTRSLLPTGLDGAEYLRRLRRTKSQELFGDHVLISPLSRPVKEPSNVLPAPPGVLEEASVPGAPRVVTFDPETLIGDGWTVQVETGFPPSDSVGPGAIGVARLTCTWINEPKRRVRVTLYLCADAAAARGRLRQLRGKLAPPPLTQVDAGQDLTFSTPDQKTIVGATMNVAYRIIDAGWPANAVSDAPGMKAELISRLASVAPQL